MDSVIAIGSLLPCPEGWVVVELEEVELEEEVGAVPLLLLPQAARIMVAASKRKATLTNVLSDSDVRFDIFFTSFHVSKWGNIPDNEMIRKAPCPSE
jgi:hypothetical protein